MKNKRGIFFSVDALIALSMIIIILLIAYPTVSYFKKSPKIQGDMIGVISSLSIGELNNSFAKQLIAEGKITNLNNSVMEQIGEFYITNLTLAKQLAANILSDLPSNENYGIWYDNTLIYSKNSTAYESAENIYTDRQFITGIREGENITSYSARAYLQKTKQTKYIYFGGYVGDGNISLNFSYYGNITSADLEIAINKNFSLYLNGVYSGNYNKSDSDYIPKKYELAKQNFNSGNNLLEIKGDNLYISGGYLKIVFDPEVIYSSTEKYFFPGIKGAINIYDGKYFPTNLTSINIFLHYNSSNRLFFNIENITIHNSTISGENSLTFTDAYLRSMLNYSKLYGKTIPIRIGLENITYNRGISSYVISVVDLSGGTSSARSSDCGNNGLCAVQSANRLLINMLLSVNNIFVGLVGNYQGAVSPTYSHALSQNVTALNNTINTWTNAGNLDLCYGIENATKILSATGSSEDLKTIVLLGTKFPNSCLGSSQNIQQRTYDLACQTWQNYSIRVNTIGIIGGSQTDSNLNSLLYNISLCANGTYNNASSSNNDIVLLYNDTIKNILNLSYNLQTSYYSGSTITTLYPDSYIEFSSPKEQETFGLNLYLEKSFDNSTSVQFSIPENSTLINAEIISYSGPKWTSKIKTNGQKTYDITELGSSFIFLGDPFMFRLPLNYLNKSNQINLNTGFSPTNIDLNGSSSNKVFYHVVKNFTSYSGITSLAEGCIWNVTNYENAYSIIPTPSNYTGTNLCKYSPETKSYNQNDAFQNSAYGLIKSLDLDSDGKIDITLNSSELAISSSEFSGIPYSWFTEVEIRTWD